MQKLYTLCAVILICAITTVEAQINLTALNTPYHQDFNTLASAGTTNDISTLPAGWSFLESGTNANTTYAAGTGSSNTGNTYSFGLDATDRALGGLLSGSLNPTIGAGFVNNTGATITSLQIVYHGEQWRLGASGRGSDRIDFQYSLDAAGLNSGIWIDADQLDFTGPINTGTVGALNGNSPLNSDTISFTISGLTIANGSIFFIRWQDFNVASSDDGLAIDNFSIIPSGIPDSQPAITFSPASLEFGDVNVNEISTLTYEVTGANLDDSITVYTQDPAFTVSTDQVQFNTSAILSPTGGIIYVRFAPTSGGVASDPITHFSGETIAFFGVSGNGFDQAANIIPVAEARSKSVGTKVTVAGRVTVANELGNPAYVQDATGGIPVFDFALASTVAIGDSIIVTGPIGVFNDQKQISGSGIFFTLADSIKRLVAPKNITIAELAAHEGMLVTVQAELINKSFVFYPQSTERITNGTAQADLRIDGDTNIPGLVKPQGITDLTGVVGRFRTNAQLLPRFREDIPGAEEPSTPADSIPKTKTLDVLTWNFEFFGAEREEYGQEFGPQDEALQLENIKLILDSLNADIIAVQEVSDDSLFAVLVSQLDNYGYTCSQRYSHSFDGPDNTFPPQKVCFIYDTTIVDVLSERVLFEELYDVARTTDPSLLPSYPGGDPSSFYSSGRLPYMLTANVTIEGVTEKISFIDIHAKSGATANDRNRREYDAAVLKDSLDAHFSNEQFIILGDLNDDLDQSIATGLPTPYTAFVSDTANYAPVTKALSDAGARSTVSFSDMIDHQILSNDLIEEYLQGSAQVQTPFGLVTNYANTTSDHLPVITRFALQAPVVTFTETSTTLSEDSSVYTVNINLSKPLSSDMQLNIAVAGDAVYGSDFSASESVNNGMLTLNLTKGTTNTSFIINVTEDTNDELQETIILSLQQSLGINTGDPAVLTISIEDNDVPYISFMERYASAPEGSEPYAVKLKLTTPPAVDHTAIIRLYPAPWVGYNTDFTTDPAADQNTIVVNIPAGSSEAQFTISPLTDNRRELPIEVLSFYLAETSPGLEITSPRLSVFSITDVRQRLVDLIVYPNPTPGIIRLTSEKLDENEIIHAELHNSHGERIYKNKGTLEQINGSLATVLQHRRNGVYTLRVYHEHEHYLIRILKN